MYIWQVYSTHSWPYYGCRLRDVIDYLLSIWTEIYLQSKPCKPSETRSQSSEMSVQGYLVSHILWKYILISMLHLEIRYFIREIRGLHTSNMGLQIFTNKLGFGLTPLFSISLEVGCMGGCGFGMSLAIIRIICSWFAIILGAFDRRTFSWKYSKAKAHIT